MSQGLLAAIVAALLTGVGTTLYAESRGISPFATTAILYVSGACFAVPLCIFFDGDLSKLSPRRALPAMGVGLCFTLAVVALNSALSAMPLSTVALLRQLSVIIPVAASLIWYREYPTHKQLVVTVLAALTIIVAAWPEARKRVASTTAATVGMNRGVDKSRGR